MIVIKNKLEIWFITGSQHLYGEESLKQVDKDSQAIINYFNEECEFPVEIIWKPVLKSAEEITNIIIDANSNKKCIGLIGWMHTFSPAKMWITGLKILNKPFMHFHTQFERDIPWNTLDMDYMNTNQSAHGGREFGFISTRMKIRRKIVAGHWKNEIVHNKIENWIRAALGWNESQNLKLARLGDNMRYVAVTEGNKVDAQIDLGYEVHGFGVGDLLKYMEKIDEQDIFKLVNKYNEDYPVTKSSVSDERFKKALYESAKIEIALKKFLDDGGFKAFTTTFENLSGLDQLPGLAAQRLMKDGYGFGAEGDWKTAALVRIMKVMSEGLKGGTSFIEDYIYHFEPGNMKELGSHMLEVCESIAESTPYLEVHPLSIGGKEAPARSVFNAHDGSAVQATVVEFGDRFRMIVNEVDVLKNNEELPKLPVARALWIPKPDLTTASTAWILAGGTHHSSLSYDVNTEQLEDLSEMLGIEFTVIDEKTNIRDFKKELKWNEIYYRLQKI